MSSTMALHVRCTFRVRSFAFIWKTLGRQKFKQRLTEHKRATRNGDLDNNIAELHLQTNHRIDWDSAECVIYSSDY